MKGVLIKTAMERLGYGYLGIDALKKIAQHPAFQGLPFILETPNDEKGYEQETRIVQGWIREEDR